MKFEYLFPEVYKKIGWVMFVVFSVLYVLSFAGVLSSLFPCKVFSLLPFTFLSENSFIQQNDGWEDEICMVGLVLSLLFISFARLKEEDEYTINLRMKSMAWAFKVYGVIVIIATLTIYGLGWYYVMLSCYSSASSTMSYTNSERRPSMKNNIRVERAILRMTQAQLAERIGVSRQTINAIEAGKYVPSTVLALKMSAIFDKPVNEFFLLEEND